MDEVDEGSDHLLKTEDFIQEVGGDIPHPEVTRELWHFVYTRKGFTIKWFVDSS